MRYSHRYSRRLNESSHLFEDDKKYITKLINNASVEQLKNFVKDNGYDFKTCEVSSDEFDRLVFNECKKYHCGLYDVLSDYTLESVYTEPDDIAIFEKGRLRGIRYTGEGTGRRIKGERATWVEIADYVIKLLGEKEIITTSLEN